MSTFLNLEWQPDRLLLNNWVYRLQHHKNDDWELGNSCFIFYKTKQLVDE